MVLMILVICKKKHDYIKNENFLTEKLSDFSVRKVGLPKVFVFVPFY